MKKNVFTFTIILLFIMIACKSEKHYDKPNDEISEDEDQSSSDEKSDNLNELYIAGHEVAWEDALRAIPEKYIQAAREEFVISYQHTSHGTHVTRGMYGLPDYKTGDNDLFGISRDSRTDGMLTVFDNQLQDYSPSGVKATDLSSNETAFIATTQNYLDAPENSDVNVIMWAWCNIAGHDVESNYIPGMAQLISEYGPGGSKIGSDDGQREIPVHFVFMTGHANAGNNLGEGKPKNLAEVIVNYCIENEYFCLDYYSIDTHEMNGKYWEDAGDDGQSSEYGGNFYLDWQNDHELGKDYWENRLSPGGEVAYGAHNSQHITANRKGMAMWWILARLAGWEGEGVASSAKH